MAIHPNSPELFKPSSTAGIDVILPKAQARKI
jgi:hypothetical protein